MDELTGHATKPKPPYPKMWSSLPPEAKASLNGLGIDDPSAVKQMSYTKTLQLDKPMSHASVQALKAKAKTKAVPIHNLGDGA